MGSLYRRGTVWWIKYRQGGRIRRESAGTSEEAEARKLLELREGNVARIGKALTFDDLAALVLADYKANGRRSLHDVQGHLDRHLYPFFSGLQARRIKTPVLSQYIALRQRQGASNATINRELAVVKRGFSLARRADLLDFAPYIPRLDEDNEIAQYLPRDTFVKLRDALPAYLRPVVTFAYVTGWRVPSEVLTRQWRHVDFEHELVRLDPGEAKNREGRVFPFTDELRACLRAQRDATPAECPWVFHRNGERIQSFRKWWDRACDVAGAPEGFRRHDFRGTAAWNLLESGASEREVMLMVGWKTRAMLDRYVKLRVEALRGAAAKLDQHVAGHSGAQPPLSSRFVVRKS